MQKLLVVALLLTTTPELALAAVLKVEPPMGALTEGHRGPAKSSCVPGGCLAVNESRNTSSSIDANAESEDPHAKPVKRPRLHKAVQVAKTLGHSVREKFRRAVHRTGRRREGDPAQDYQAAICRSSPTQCAAGVEY